MQFALQEKTAHRLLSELLSDRQMKKKHVYCIHTHACPKFRTSHYFSCLAFHLGIFTCFIDVCVIEFFSTHTIFTQKNCPSMCLLRQKHTGISFTHARTRSVSFTLKCHAPLGHHFQFNFVCEIQQFLSCALSFSMS